MDLRVSVIVPVYNDELGIRTTIDSLLNQDFPKEYYEIIVVDNGSTDNTIGTIEEYNNNYIKVYQERKIQGSYAARNQGIKHCQGLIVCFIDSDMTASKDYISSVYNYMMGNKIDYLACKVTIYPVKNNIVSRFNMINGFPVKSYMEKLHFAPTCCLSVNRKIFSVVGTFDSRIESGGDLDFGQKVYKEGLVQRYVDSIQLSHPSRSSYSSLVSKAKRVGRGVAQLSHYYPEKYTHLYLNYFKLKRYLPRNFFNISRLREREYSLLDAFIFSIFHIPYSFSSVISLIKEKKKLSNHCK